MSFVLNTPSKTELNPAANANVNNSASSNSHTFECPECDKKFVSYYGLFQHFDQHPNLAVSCTECQITFENHQALCLHNTKAHPNFFGELNEFKSFKSGPQSAKKSEAPKSTTPTGRIMPLIKGAKQLNFQSKSKSQGDELAENTTLNVNNELLALPSIMTRTSRLTNGEKSFSQPVVNTTSVVAAMKTTAAIQKHNLTYKTSGFADLSFIDFSCLNFPRIAQNYCELWPRKLQLSSGTEAQLQPLHNYVCVECGFYFPCKASLTLHKMKKKFASSSLALPVDESTKNNTLCPLFMTNSKYLCYEKCLEEIIDKIEEAEDSEANFFECFGLVDRLRPSGCTRSASLVTRLLCSLRTEMLDINPQFIVELDRWKLMHSSDSSFLGDTAPDFDAANYSNKIHLKPHVNLNRPLLIRSKKLKRHSQKATSSGNSSFKATTASKAAAAQSAPTFTSVVNAINAANLSPAPQLNKPSLTPIATQAASSVDLSAKASVVAKPLNGPSVATFSKPFFTATSGNFSAAMSSFKTTTKPPVSATTTSSSIANEVEVNGDDTTEETVSVAKKRKLLQPKYLQKQENSTKKSPCKTKKSMKINYQINFICLYLKN